MKKLIQVFTGLTALVVGINLWAQSGIVNFANNGQPPDRRIYAIENRGTPQPAGNGYRIALYWGPPGTPEQGLVQVGGSAGLISGGIFVGGNRTVAPLLSDGGVATFQARAWCSDGGRFQTYEEAFVYSLSGGGFVILGKGPVFDMQTKNPANPLETPPQVGAAPGWAGFIMMGGLEGSGVCVPEVSSIAIAALGAAALLLCARRKNANRT